MLMRTVIGMHLESLLSKAFEKRRELFALVDTNCFRLFNGDGDEISGLTIDLYGEFILIQYFSSDLAQYTGQILEYLKSAGNLLPVEPKGLLLKNRIKPAKTKDIRSARESELIGGSLPPPGYAVRQNGVEARVDLVSGQNTGVFLDMREVRDSLAGFYRTSDIMLNLFSYTALFSIHALRNGITGTVNVDLSKRVLSRAKENYRLNGLSIDERDFLYGDARDWIRIFRKKSRMFSFIVFDPPTFSRNRLGNFSSSRHYQDYLSLLEPLVSDGYVLTSVNSYSISVDLYRSFHPAQWRLELLHHESSDFPYRGDPYLKTGLWKIR
jgi:23S rRNA (cytosine1962-C5)-methyltransferase